MFKAEIALYINFAIILLLGVYPLYVWIKSIVLRKEIHKSDSFIQPVSIIIACSNEEKFIRQKIDSFIDKHEWIEDSEIIIVSNGSMDTTNDILTEYSQIPFIHIIVVHDQISKIKAVNIGVKSAKHDLLIFSDCRQVMKKGSIRNLIKNFNDPDVGTVNSTLTDADSKRHLSFRSFLNFIAFCESKSGSSLNIFGALYAQRKSVFREFPTDILFDDLFVVVSTIIQKKRLVAEKNAIIYDIPFSNYYVDNRIERLARGLLIFLFNHFKMISKLPFNILLRFMIYKYLKLFMPFVLVFLILDLLYLTVQFVTVRLLIILFLSIISILAIKIIRHFVFQFIKINYYFFYATLQFLFMNKRSISWDKLNISQSAITDENSK